MPTVSNDGVQIHYEAVGSGPPLVLQHGRLGTGQFWVDLGYVDALQAERQLILIDARGHGRSDKPQDPTSYSASYMAGDIVAVLDDLEITRADLFGYSMGGRIGFMALTYFPERFRSLIASGAAPYGPAISRQEELTLASTLAEGMEAYVDRVDAMLNRVLPDADRQALLQNDVVAMAALARQGADWPNVVKRVAASGLPIQLFGGSTDPIWPRIEQAHGELPGSRIEQFPGLGHGGELRQPDLVLPLLRLFLSQVDALELANRSEE